MPPARCRQCGGALPVGSKRRRFYCGSTCRNRAAYEKDRAHLLTRRSERYEQELDRERSRYLDYYAEHREERLAYAARRRRLLPPKPCRDCGAATPSRRHWYCETCGARHLQMRRERKGYHLNRPSNNVRGYGGEHQRSRKAWKGRVEAGEVVCGWCDAPIYPETRWHLSHPTDDKSLPPTPWHERCNTQYAATVTRRRRAQARKAAARGRS